MKFVHKALGLLLASAALSSCGGGGGDGHGAFEPPQPSIITLSAVGGSRTMPLNVGGASTWSPSSPYTIEVDIHWTNADGSPISGHDLSCSVTNLAIMSIHILDDASTPDDESAVNWGNVQVHSDTGHAICWVFSTGQAGDATLNVGGVDPLTNATVSAQMSFTVQNASGPLPASVQMTADPPGVYFSGSNGRQSTTLSALVLDGGGNPVPDPASGNSGADNVQFEIVTNPNGGANLQANSVGGVVTGSTVVTHTVRGVATASFQSGSVQGPIQIRATADRSDNNVTNGISDPVSSTFSVVVSDGKLYSLEITSPVVAPNLPGIVINPISDDVTGGTGGGIPPDPDATLSLTVSALGTDRQGNPVLPGTSISFGSVDEPVGAPGSAEDNQFLISGIHGNPQEGNTLFTATDGHFQTAGGGAGPGDALVVFGKAVEGNADLVSAVTVASISSETSLNASSPFNRNDTTGTSVDYGAVLPYLIGRSQHGNISSPASTNEIGVAHTTLNYTVNSVGNAVAIWASGDGIDSVTGGQRRVTDAGTLVYPGVGPATLLVSPLTIEGNSTANITVCVTDALGIPLRGVPVGYFFSLSGGGTGSVDGNGNAGTFDQLTGTDGCAVGSATTSGIPGTSAGGDAGTLTISAAGQSQDITITAPVVRTLTVTVTGDTTAGVYTVSPSSSGFSPPGQGGTPCDATVPPTGATNTCTYTFTDGATVTLQKSFAAANGTDPEPTPFTWGGNCATSTTITMTADATCTATWGAAGP
ncbi:MAG TPA: hypothetical protein VFL30_01620 [Rhodanobacteraceae bacterium]|nr:hypothetical protein [Rhodanobacteraceae bacterium]